VVVVVVVVVSCDSPMGVPLINSQGISKCGVNNNAKIQYDCNCLSHQRFHGQTPS
jgi:hypothetical protein